MSLVKGFRQSPLSLPAYRALDLLRQAASVLAAPRPLSLDRVPPPFFIIGSGRSGTTLMRAILASQGSLGIPPESYVLPDVIRAYRSLAYLAWPDLCRIIIGRFESSEHYRYWETDLGPACREAIDLPPDRRDLAGIVDIVFRCYLKQHFPAATLWGDKSPSNTTYVTWLDKLFPSARYIHLLRDGRDVVHSFLRTGITTNLRTACEDWQVRVRAARRFGRRIGSARYLEVRYEDLVRQPRNQIASVTSFLGLTFSEAMLHHETRAPDLQDIVQVPHYAGVLRGINDGAVSRWQQGLSRTEQAYVQRKLHTDLAATGYLDAGTDCFAPLPEPSLGSGAR